ncbi:MAG: FG-GAP repeat protein [Planctomycetes bacterium]|nr:FG-GAP repeat protein [Planctomycetota bacterium]
MRLPLRLVFPLGPLLLPFLNSPLHGQTLLDKWPGTNPGDQLGSCVRFVDDLNGDGVSDVIVGAWSADANGADAGTAYVLSGNDLTEIFRWHGDQAGDRFGWSVDGIDDIDGDDVPDVIVAARGNPFVNGQPSYWKAFSGATGIERVTIPGGGSNGSMHVSNHTGREILATIQDPVSGLVSVKRLDGWAGNPYGEWVQPSPLHAGFGRATQGDVQTPQLGAAVVGADSFPDDSFSPSYRTGQIAFVENCCTTARWTADGDQPLDYLGAAVSVIRDLNGDGFDEVIAGAPARDTFLTDRPGFARVYSGIDGQVLFTVRGDRNDDLFGSSVCGIEDYDGDGTPDFAVGAPAGGANGTGYVRVFSGTNALELTTLHGPTNTARFGASIDSAGAKREGIADLLIGAPGENASAGAAFLYESPNYPGGTPSLRLLFGVNQTPNRRDVQEAWPNTPTQLFLHSPDGALVNAPYALWIQVLATGTWGGPTPGLNGVQFDLGQPGTLFSLLSGVLPSQGVTLPLPVQPGFGGYSAFFQALAVSNRFPTGWSTSHAIELRHLADRTIYVSALTGSNANSGLDPLRPVATLDHAYQLAIALGDPANYVPYPRILVAAGTYREALRIDHPIDMSGGYDSQTWARAPGIYSQVLTDHHGVRVRDLNDPTTIEGFEFIAGNAPHAGPTNWWSEISSMALDVRDTGPELTMRDCLFRSGNGGSGASGGSTTTPGADGDPGDPGASGRFAAFFIGSTPEAGGSGGSGAYFGGRGGDGGTSVCTSSLGSVCLTGQSRGGRPGDDSGNCNNGGSGGARSGCGIAGDGADGTRGADGSEGTAGRPNTSPAGYVDSLGAWRPHRAGSGGDGGDACGGGGGGGGGAADCAQQFALGASGGGGGGGGFGGYPGGGGTGGGASFCVYLYDASPTFRNCQFTTGTGGAGGRGGNGSVGGTGGSGGGGGSGFNGTIAGFGVGSGSGGTGGEGGTGGAGGGGGGGHGGPSYCIFLAGTSSPPSVTSNGNQFQPGSGGVGGPGGSSGSGVRAFSGNTGQAGVVGR